MSSNQIESEPPATEKSTSVDVEAELSTSVVNKSESLEISEKSDGHNTSGASVDRKVAKKKKAKASPSSQPSKKMKKDPNKPEYPRVGYVRYMNDRREELRKEVPDMHHLEVTKKIGEEWMSLSEDKKQPYLEAAKTDKTRYKLEMKAYNKKLKRDERESTSTPSKRKSSKLSKDAHTSDSTMDDSPKKKKKKISATQNQSNGIELKPASKIKQVNVQNESKKTSSIEQTSNVSSVTLLNTPPPTPPQIDGAPIFGDIPIFTDKFLEHNRQMETELKKIRKMNTDYEQQNAVLEKHVENVRAGISKTNAEITDLRNANDKLMSYLDTLRQKLATQLRNLSIPSKPNGANIDNIDKYMNDLYDMAKDNSHGPASLNKAKDLLRKVDLNIQQAK